MRRALLLLFTVGFLAHLVGCQSLLDAFNSGENERLQNEANRERVHRERAEARKRRLEPIATRTTKPVEKERVVALDPMSPEGALRALLERRLACQTAPCRSETLKVLRERRDELMPAISILFQGQRMPIRLEAIKLAGLFQYAPAAEPLGRVLAVEGGPLREEGIWALGSIGEVGSLPVLERLAQLENPPRVMDALCKALGQLGHISGFETIETLYFSGSRDTKLACLQAAASLRSPRREDFLRKATTDPRSSVSRRAADLLTRLHGVSE